MAHRSTPFHGKKARIEKDNMAVDFTGSYTFNVSCDLAPADRMGQDWHEFEPGMGGFNGTFDGQLVAGNTEQKALIDNIVTATPGTKLTGIKFLLDTSLNAYTGDIFIVGMNVTSNTGAVCAVSFSFTGNGAPDITAAA